MFQIDDLSKIINEYNPLKDAVDNYIKNKCFAPNGLTNPIRKLSEKEILFGINSLIRDAPRDFICLSIVDIIDWTPIKLFQTAYFMFKIYDKFWIISRELNNSYVSSVITMEDYIKFLFNIGIKDDSTYIENKYHPVFTKFRAALKLLDNNNVALIENVSYDLKIKINHYLYKLDKIVYYVAVYHNNDSFRVYKPVIFHNLRK
jgi:hypothetical protein